MGDPQVTMGFSSKMGYPPSKDTSMDLACSIWGVLYIYTLWLFNIAMENGPFIDGLPIKNGDFPWLC
jgi:hypothetical protein